MTSKQNIDQQVKADNLIVFIFFLHLLSLLGASAVPEGRFLFWLPINLTVEVLIIVRLILLWKRYSKHEPRRYNSIQLYWMLTGLSFFMMMPFVKITFGTFAFLPMLTIAILLFLFSHLWKERIASVFVNPKKKGQLVKWPKALAVIIIIGIVIMTALRFTPAHPNDGLSVFLFLLGGFSIFIATPFSLSGERIEELKQD
ncbi:hypothetical protein H9649_09170 [Sporosarcina sp. Sa2YVA2]|uniref:Uncharacterized protein n=1 Tax=Sporosarcina quadrami TaxID=2762234 RepID=A0ABR8U9Q1_9BACL|nr:hypothetical protein [Sporosarcina quadrami]MBD7984751.1 hypothetical protein [Sporosarcina quadrami]